MSIAACLFGLMVFCGIGLIVVAAVGEQEYESNSQQDGLAALYEKLAGQYAAKGDLVKAQSLYKTLMDINAGKLNDRIHSG